MNEELGDILYEDAIMKEWLEDQRRKWNKAEEYTDDGDTP